MKPRRINQLLIRTLWLLGAMTVLSGSAWAVASPGCASMAASEPGGTGMGGTGITAEGSGMGGTGIRPEFVSGGVIAGNVIFSRGTATAQSQGGSRPLAKGAPVCVGETIVTSQSASVQIRMADGGMITVRPDTKMKIDVFKYNGKEDGTERSVITLLQGGFRALTGMIGHTHKENYTIRTPFANIGIRGTDHEPMFVPNSEPGQTSGAQPGTYDKVNSGGVVIQNAEGSVDVKPNEIGYVPNESTAVPVILREVPRFYGPGSGEGGREHGSGEHDSREAGPGRMESERGGRDEGTGIRAPEPPSETRSPEVTAPETQGPDMPEMPEAPETPERND